jgi:hypothetical protein
MVSHPFAKKKAKGWGTELVEEETVKDLVVSAEDGAYDAAEDRAAGR